MQPGDLVQIDLGYIGLDREAAMRLLDKPSLMLTKMPGDPKPPDNVETGRLEIDEVALVVAITDKIVFGSKHNPRREALLLTKRHLGWAIANELSVIVNER